MMNTLELERILETDECIRKIFQGALPADYLQDLTNLPACFIANTEKSSHEGTHWLTFHSDEKGHGLMFDSFGRSPDMFNPTFQKFMDRNSKTWTFNPIQFQSTFSDCCGQFCIYVLCLLAHGYSYNEILNSLSKTDLTQNDQLVSQFTEKYFNTTQL